MYKTSAQVSLVNYHYSQQSIILLKASTIMSLRKMIVHECDIWTWLCRCSSPKTTLCYIKANYEHGYMHVLHLLQIFIMPDVLSCAVDHMIRQCCDCVVTWEGSMDRGTGVQLRSLRTVLFLQCTITIFRCTFCASVTLWVHRNT